MITPENSGASQLACNIINNTFLALDGFAGMRLQMDATEYKADHFATELARIADREIKAEAEAGFIKFAELMGIDDKTLKMSNIELAS